MTQTAETTKAEKNGKTAASDTADQPARKGLSKEEKTALFKKYKTGAADLKKAEAAVDSASSGLSTICQEIYEKAGPGPYIVDGVEVLAVKRKKKNQEDTYGYFFRTRDSRDAEVIALAIQEDWTETPS